ncbi:hypothetical protein QC763_601170 [Podospora pseudopauciseta]|uniref:Uncharacterized protein n=2 Tax=Podospora TaxID=5144 RepID=A0ABR0H545_9PEZI|nr:hypothetical protein QC763_601170 [Podospora pseudopauciseta]KAK4671332.1 hypothetical protein QC764_601170 [Podospora pseudoanserina]
MGFPRRIRSAKPKLKQLSSVEHLHTGTYGGPASALLVCRSYRNHGQLCLEDLASDNMPRLGVVAKVLVATQPQRRQLGIQTRSWRGTKKLS